MSSLIAAMLLASTSAVPSGGPALPSGGPALSLAELKCPGRVGDHPEMLEAVVILDDEVIEWDGSGYPPGYVDPGDIALFTLACWQFIEEYYGVQTIAGGVYVRTKSYDQRLDESQLAALDAVIAAQDRHRDEHGGYAAGVEDLPGFALSGYDLPGYFELTLESRDGGWSAGVGPAAGWRMEFSRGGSSYWRSACRTFAGSAPEEWAAQRREGQPPLRERQPVCS